MCSFRCVFCMFARVRTSMCVCLCLYPRTSVCLVCLSLSRLMYRATVTSINTDYIQNTGGRGGAIYLGVCLCACAYVRVGECTSVCGGCVLVCLRTCVYVCFVFSLVIDVVTCCRVCVFGAYVLTCVAVSPCGVCVCVDGPSALFVSVGNFIRNSAGTQGGAIFLQTAVGMCVCLFLV